MDLLQAGVDRSVVARWLGHESVETTQIDLEATLAIKERLWRKHYRQTEDPVAISLETNCRGSSIVRKAEKTEKTMLDD
jgi:integrase